MVVVLCDQLLGLRQLMASLLECSIYGQVQMFYTDQGRMTDSIYILMIFLWPHSHLCSCIEPLIPFMTAPPSWPTAQKPYFQKSSHWRSGFQHMKCFFLGGEERQKHSVQSTYFRWPPFPSFLLLLNCCTTHSAPFLKIFNVIFLKMFPHSLFFLFPFSNYMAQS